MSNKDKQARKGAYQAAKAGGQLHFGRLRTGQRFKSKRRRQKDRVEAQERLAAWHRRDRRADSKDLEW